MNIFSTIRTALLIILALLAFVLMAEDQWPDPFVTPETLKDNVAFWKMVYTEIPLTQGVLHDRDYPLVLYGKISIGNKGGREEKSIVENAEMQIESLLVHLQTTPETSWTDEEKRIRGLFAAHAPAGALDSAVSRIRFQRGQKERFMQGLERSGMYLDTIRAILKAFDIPQRLAFLPHVESSFDYTAYSHVGAAGLWQFMRSTGKLFLTINYSVDERLDPILATYAAAKLLRRNYDVLQSWPLAITAYNHGLGGMKRAVEVTGTNDIAVIIDKYEGRIFKFASKNFYACFIAASEIAADPVPYVGEVHYLPRLTFATMELKEFIRPAALSAYLKIPEQTIEELNPALRPVVFSQQKQIPAGFILHIPATASVASSEKMLAAIPDSLKSSEAEHPRYYKVNRGDNLAGIASRIGVSLPEILAENNISKSERIFAGQILQIPAKQREPLVSAGSVQKKAETTMVALAAPTGESAVSHDTILRKMLVWENATEDEYETNPISVTAEVPVVQAVEKPVVAESLRAVAYATADTLPLAVKTGVASPAPGFDVTIYNLETVLSAAPDQAEIRISVDETIGHLADWLGIPSTRIRQLNRLNQNSSIRIGQKLIIPIDKAGSLDRFAQARLEYHMALEEDFYIQYKVGEVRRHVIEKGETLWDLCNGDDEIPLWLFKKYNKAAELSQLMPGTSIWIPVIAEKSEAEIAADKGVESGSRYPLFHQTIRSRSKPATLAP